MHVFIHCIGLRDMALEIPTSILYQISAPSFPQELRDYLLMSGNLKKISNKEIKKLVQKYQEEGIESIEKDIDELTRCNIVLRQVHYTFDLCESVLRILDDLEQKIKSRGQSNIWAFDEYKDQTQYHQPEAAQINLRLYDAVINAFSTLDGAVSASRREIDEYEQRLRNEM